MGLEYFTDLGELYIVGSLCWSVAKGAIAVNDTRHGYKITKKDIGAIVRPIGWDIYYIGKHESDLVSQESSDSTKI